jgi:uridine kinase
MSLSGTNRLNSPEAFSAALFEKMKAIQPGLAGLLLYEFRYALENLLPEAGWDSVELDSRETIESLIASRDFYESIQLKPREGDRIILDHKIAGLARVLFAGLAQGFYSEAWVKERFYFDIRGFFFLPRTIYFTEEVKQHLGGKPYRRFEKKQQRFERFQGVGYKDFMEANAEIDQAFIESLLKVLAVRGTPLLITLAGPTAAGKTEITERMFGEFENMGRKVATIEVDNFLLDRDFREDKGIGKESTHYEIFKRSLEELLQGRKVAIPRYNFVNGTSSHALDGSLRPGRLPLEIEPADIIFLEGNFPFQIEEIARQIGIKAVYLTDDPIRLKRKWKRDIDYRKKYDPFYFQNRFFKTQYLRAEDIYRPLMQVCDFAVDTTQASLWATPEIAGILDL